MTGLYLALCGYQVSLTVSCMGVYQKAFECPNKLHPLVVLYPLLY